jgi:uncharacterized protein YggU (UPF0235/DUF167 family)
MSMPATCYSPHSEGLMVEIRLTPRADRDAVDGIGRDCGGAAFLAVRVTAAPSEGAANAALVALLSRRWRLPKSAFALVRGESARVKRLSVTAPAARLAAALADLTEVS